MASGGPSDHDSNFMPEFVTQGQTRIDGMDAQIIGIYASGSTRTFYLAPMV